MQRTRCTCAKLLNESISPALRAQINVSLTGKVERDNFAQNAFIWIVTDVEVSKSRVEWKCLYEKIFVAYNTSRAFQIDCGSSHSS